MTREQQIKWLENATAEELMAHYGGLNAAMARVGTPVDTWIQLSQEKLLAEEEIMTRLYYAEACRNEEEDAEADEAITRNAY